MFKCGRPTLEIVIVLRVDYINNAISHATRDTLDTTQHTNTISIMNSLDQTKVAIVAWDGMDLTDFTGPMETLSHARDEQSMRLYDTTIVADRDVSTTSQNVSIKRDIDVDDFLNIVERFDILIIPGGGGFTADRIPSVPGVGEALQAYISLPPRNDQPRILVSICAGVFFLAQTGLLAGRVVTGHYASLGELKKICEKHGGSHVVRQHYVNSGVVQGTRIIVSGGITSGFDATLYLIELQHGLVVAEKARATMDAHWRREALPFGTF